MQRVQKRSGTPNIRVRNLQRRVRIDLPSLQLFAECALAAVVGYPARNKTQLGKLAQIWVLLISDRRMTGLHRRFLNQRGATDVITFDHGEIFISLDTARKQARVFKTTT